MGIPKIIQIPCHHVLANQNALKLKKGAPLKQFFNINLGIGIIKKATFFVRIFDISPYVFTQIPIGRAHWMHNLSTYSAYFWWARLPQNKKYLKKRDDDILIMFSHGFIIFRVLGPIKIMPSGYSLDAKFNSTSNELSWSKFE